MPRTLRPNLLATVTLATAVGVSGCIFPFSRGSQANLDDTVAEMSPPGPAEHEDSGLADLPALNAAHVPAPPVEVAQAPHGKKQLPPFARFLNNMLGGGSGQPEPATAAANQANVPAQPAKVAPAETAEITPAATLIANRPQASAPVTKTAPTNTLPPVVRADSLPPVERQTTPSQTPSQVRVASEPNLPEVVTPTNNPAADMPDVVSRFSAKATKIVEGSRPQTEQQPPQPQSASQITAQPAPQGTTLDAMASSPWNESSLMKKAKENSSSETSTLIHALDLALETVGNEGTTPAVTASPAAPHVAETQAPTKTDSLPASEPPAQSVAALPPQPVVSAASPQQANLPSSQNVNNPLRSGKTDWTGRSSLGSAQQPQTVVNNKFSAEPTTSSRASQWSASLEPEQQAETARKGAQIVAAQQPPPALPATTVNPYAVNEETQSTPAESLPPQPKAPQIITNQMAAPAKRTQKPIRKSPASAEPAVATTNTLHFETSVVNKLQAASELTNWNFDPSSNNDLPKIVEGKEETPQTEKPPQTTINSTIEPASQPAIQARPVEPQPVPQPLAPEAPVAPQPAPQPTVEVMPSVPQPAPQILEPSLPVESQPAQSPADLPADAPLPPVDLPPVEMAPAQPQPAPRPTIQAVPARPQLFRPQAITPPPVSAETPAASTAAPRGIMIRPAEAAPLPTEKSDGAWRPTAVPAHRAPSKLAPVIRSGDNSASPSPPQGTKKYIID